MGLKKYEIITVGSDKRVRALRSWRVQDRYVNIGDVGGIVYDEKTLSQDGACWLFRGNFNFLGARIGGDSVVDVGEAVLATNGTPNVDILGTSTLVGNPTRFASDQTAADAVVLTAADFEQGTFNHTAGANWETWKTVSNNFVRIKSPIFMGGRGVTLKVDVPGYAVQAYVLDRDGLVISSAFTVTGVGVTLAVPAGQYFVLTLRKEPVANTVPADATAAQIKFTGTYETKLVMVDSRLELNPATSTGVITIRPGGTYTVASGAKYPDSVITDSKVTINTTSNKSVRFMSDLSNVNATIDATMSDAQSVGTYRSVNSLVFSGAITGTISPEIPLIIQAYNCDNMVISSTNFPGLAAMRTAGVPIRFYNCNLNNGRFYHHARIANTYRDINFDLATADLGKATLISSVFLVSSEVNGLYRLCAPGSSGFGALVEDYNSIIRFQPNSQAEAYNSTIYADASISGEFLLKGTNVFGSAMKHDASNTQNVLAVQGSFNANISGQTITGIVSNTNRCVAPTRFRINGSQGIIVNVPAGIECCTMFTDANGTIQSTGAFATGAVTPAAGNLKMAYAYLLFRKSNDTAITPDDVKGVTVTTYNGCRLVNTKATSATISGNVRVEDNATLIDVSVTGTGYFGGNSVIQAPSALVGQLPIEGAAYMSDNAVFAPSAVNTSAGISLLDMKDNAVFAGLLTGASTNYNIRMSDNAQFLGAHGSRSGFVMRGNSFVAASVTVAPECRGLLVLEDDARIENGDLRAIGYITIRGKYKQTAGKVWTGKRTITDVNEPGYDNNVKTKYDF